MKPSTIPDAEVWEGAERVTVRGYADVADVETLLDIATTGDLDGAARYCIRLELDDDDRASIAAGGVMWLALYGYVPPFSVQVLPDSAALTGPHTISWRLVEDRVISSVHCSAPVDADCRLWCAEGCEETCRGADGVEHARADYGQCLAVAWLNAGAGCDDIAQLYDGPDAAPHDGVVDIRWDDNEEAYVWSYAVRKGDAAESAADTAAGLEDAGHAGEEIS